MYVLKVCYVVLKLEVSKSVAGGDFFPHYRSIRSEVNEKGLSHQHRVKVVNKPGPTSDRILDEIDDVIKSKPEHLVIHVGTNDLTNGINLLNDAKKIVKKITKKLFKTSIAFQL